MKKILVIGGSKGIGKAIIASLIEKNNVINLSRTPPSLEHANLIHHNCDKPLGYVTMYLNLQI